MIKIANFKTDRLRVVSNFDDGDCGQGEIYTRARNFEETLPSCGVASKFRAQARVYFARSTMAVGKLETTHSLQNKTKSHFSTRNIEP